MHQGMALMDREISLISSGKAGDLFVTGDWNSDGKTEIGVVRNNNTWLLDASGNGAFGREICRMSSGKPGMYLLPVTGTVTVKPRSELYRIATPGYWTLPETGRTGAVTLPIRSGKPGMCL